MSESESIDVNESSSQSIVINRNNPMDFEKFITECCELSEEYNTPKSDLKLAHRIWSKCTTKESIRNLDDYLKAI